MVAVVGPLSQTGSTLARTLDEVSSGLARMVVGLMTRKPVGSPLHFHFLQVTHFSLSNSCLTDKLCIENRKIIKSIFFLACYRL